MLAIGTVVKGRWKISKKIGQGAFGEIYQTRNLLTGEDVALKVEKVDSKKQVLKLEVAVLKRLQECPNVCRYITCGRYGEFNYLAMELLGENLSELRRKQIDGCFSLTTTLKLGEQLLKVIQSMHQLGYLHRDIKPSNFAMGLGSKKRTVFVIDFGLSRRYVLADGEVRPPRDSTGFRGTARYASIYSHRAQDLGRRDDLWSLFYMLVEFAKGQLPWRKLKEKEQIGEMKNNIDDDELLGGLPKEFYNFGAHLRSLDFMSTPDYDFLHGLLMKMMDRTDQTSDRAFYDWELKSNSSNADEPPSHTAITSLGTNSAITTKLNTSARIVSPKSPANRASKKVDEDRRDNANGENPDSFSDSGRRYKETNNTSDGAGLVSGESKRPKGQRTTNGIHSDTASEEEDHSQNENKGEESFLATPPAARTPKSLRPKSQLNPEQIKFVESTEVSGEDKSQEDYNRTRNPEKSATGISIGEDSIKKEPEEAITSNTNGHPNKTDKTTPPKGKGKGKDKGKEKKEGGCCTIQ
eukprot:TRINITY_DN2101_c0_g1_i3.p1 TRINITY_DN2101_c0_g1~~TRINITY_DN2101_c0_g1_i3.p1  ORF type:complete len:523 (-),score=151.80 TRINITY_DN2101_c0_g1_i3:246-1814(-)